MLDHPSEAVRRFRARFAGLAAEQRAAAPTTPEERLRAAIDLQAFNLMLELDRVRSQLGEADERELVRELNRRRLATPMPVSLRDRARHVDPRPR